MKVIQSCPTLCDPMGYSPWNSPGQNSEVGSLSLLQGILPTQGSNPGLQHCRRILYQLSQREAQENWSGLPIPSPADPPNPGIESGNPALQVDSLPTELSRKPKSSIKTYIVEHTVCLEVGLRSSF